jgi:hypothetical protein
MLASGQPPKKSPSLKCALLPFAACCVLLEFSLPALDCDQRRSMADDVRRPILNRGLPARLAADVALRFGLIGNRPKPMLDTQSLMARVFRRLKLAP